MRHRYSAFSFFFALALLLLSACSSSSSDTASSSDLEPAAVPADCEVQVELSNGPAQCSSYVAAPAETVPSSALSAVCSNAQKNDVPTLIVIGDSFSEGVATELDKRLDDEVNFCSLSSFGARTSDWMQDRDLLNLGYGIRSIALAILQRSAEPMVVVSIGAPDVGNDHAALGNDVYRKVHCDLQTIIAEFRAIAPSVSVAISGYAIANINPGFASQRLDLGCPEGAAQQMNASLIEDPVTGEQIIEFPRCVNSVLYGLDEVFAELDAKADFIKYTSAYGALQDRTPGDPDLDRFANPLYYRDCVHMNTAGQERYIDALEALGLLGGLLSE